jgi:hypothetical protein
MNLTIIDSFKNVKRIRIKYHNGTCEISWPIGTNILEKDRQIKLHAGITRCFEHDEDFKDSTLVLKSNVQLDRLDKLDYCDLRWEAIDLTDDEPVA